MILADFCVLLHPLPPSRPMDSVALALGGYVSFGSALSLILYSCSPSPLLCTALKKHFKNTTMDVNPLIKNP